MNQFSKSVAQKRAEYKNVSFWRLLRSLQEVPQCDLECHLAMYRRTSSSVGSGHAVLHHHGPKQ